MWVNNVCIFPRELEDGRLMSAARVTRSVPIKDLWLTQECVIHNGGTQLSFHLTEVIILVID